MNHGGIAPGDLVQVGMSYVRLLVDVDDRVNGAVVQHGELGIALCRRVFHVNDAFSTHRPGQLIDRPVDFVLVVIGDRVGWAFDAVFKRCL